MTGLRLSLRSAAYYWRAHLSVLAGTAIAGALMVGAMLVGDSVRYSLKQSALLRLGNIHHALSTQGRFFRQDFAERLEHEVGARVAPVLLLRGIAMTQDDSGGEGRQANNVQVIGIDGRFFEFAELAGEKGMVPGEDEIVVNAKLAAALQIKTGDRISVRIGKPSLFPRDAPLSARTGDDTIRGTFTVTRIMTDAELGRFSLAAEQTIPCNVFVSLKWLQRAADMQDRVNLLLAGEDGRSGLPNGEEQQSPGRIPAGEERQSRNPRKFSGGYDIAPSQGAQALNEAISRVWRIEDAGLALRAHAGLGLLRLESDRIFMDPAVSGAALAAVGDAPGHEETPVGALTYLVNSISRQGNSGVLSTPYSFMVALSPSTDRALGPVPADMADDEIMVNRWLADFLSARTGDTVKVAYYELTPANRFVEKSRTFHIRGILEMNDVAAEKDLGPKFPGLTDVERCTDWDIGIPLEKAKVEDKANEAYWEEYRATPKAFVTLKAGREMWANRFGDLSAVRYAAKSSDSDVIAERLRRKLDPAGAGLTFVPVRMQALKAVGEAMDFGQLFFGMSLFLIIAALMLTGLLFAFGIQQRSADMGLLLAVGWRPGRVRRLLMQEGSLAAGFGSLAGALLGVFYTKSLIWGLGKYWQGAVANSTILYHAEPLTLSAGAVACFVCAMVSMAIAIRRESSRPARELLSGESSLSVAPAFASAGASRTLWRGGSLQGWSWGETITIASWAGLVVSAGIIMSAVASGMHHAVPAFFAAGGLLLLSGLGLIRQLLVRLDQAGGRLTILVLGIRNAGRRRARSVTVAALLACGCFLVFSVSSMREDVGAGASKRSSGTGGFAIFGESTLPVQGDLDSVDGRKKLRLDGEPVLKDVGIVSLKVRDGDDASCLNLNRAQTPRLLGVDPDDLARRNAFVQGQAGEKIWDLLNEKLQDGVVPGIAGDGNTAAWGLAKKIGLENGDTLTYRDERGEKFKVKLVGSLPMRLSVFQGSILIPAGAFTAKYPSENGYRMFLVDAPAGAESNVRDVLSRRLGRLGIDLVAAVDRLREFYEVESTYMAMFLVLGGLGLLLGSAGMGIVVMRNVLERRGELGLMKAVGYSNAQLRMVLLAEHWLILAAGLALGILSSLAAMWPSLCSPGAGIPYRTMLLLACSIGAFNLLWIAVSVRFALRGGLFNALRNE